MGSPGGFLWPLSEGLGALGASSGPSPRLWGPSRVQQLLPPLLPCHVCSPPGRSWGWRGRDCPCGSPREGKRAAVKITPGPAPAHCGFLRFTALPGGEEAGTGRLGAGFDPFTTRRIFPPFLPGRTLGRGLWWAPAPELPAAPWVGVGGEAAGENSQPHSCAGGQRDSEAKISAADPEIPAGFCKEEEGGEEVAGASLSCRRRGVNPGQGSEGGSRWQGGHGGVPAAGLGRQGLMGGSSSSSSSI